MKGKARKMRLEGPFPSPPPPERKRERGKFAGPAINFVVEEERKMFAQRKKKESSERKGAFTSHVLIYVRGL